VGPTNARPREPRINESRIRPDVDPAEIDPVVLAGYVRELADELPTVRYVAGMPELALPHVAEPDELHELLSEA